MKPRDSWRDWISARRAQSRIDPKQISRTEYDQIRRVLAQVNPEPEPVSKAELALMPVLGTVH